MSRLWERPASSLDPAARNRYSQQRSRKHRKARLAPGPLEFWMVDALFRSHLFGFAFLAHQFQLALRRFDLRVHFLLYASRSLFELR